MHTPHAHTTCTHHMHTPHAHTTCTHHMHTPHARRDRCSIPSAILTVLLARHAGVMVVELAPGSHGSIMMHDPRPGLRRANPGEHWGLGMPFTKSGPWDFQKPTTAVGSYLTTGHVHNYSRTLTTQGKGGPQSMVKHIHMKEGTAQAAPRTRASPHKWHRRGTCRTSLWWLRSTQCPMCSQRPGHGRRTGHSGGRMHSQGHPFAISSANNNTTAQTRGQRVTANAPACTLPG
jgi:hypothetical protein